MNENSEYLAPLEARRDCGMCGSDNADSRTDCRICAKPRGYQWKPESRIVAECWTCGNRYGSREAMRLMRPVRLED